MSTTAGSAPGRTSAPPALPAGFSIELDPRTRQLTEAVLFGGSPARAMRLTRAGCRALAELRSGPVKSAAAGVLARKLTDAGMAHPRPPQPATPATVTVLIPVRDRYGELDRCLAALGSGHQVIVVDDGSADPRALADVAARHGARLLRRPASGGPAAARNTGLAAVRTDLVALLDSDCVPPPGWIGRLATHFSDPLVAAVAPRIVVPEDAAGARSAARRYTAARDSLDLGQATARVVPGTRVAYVPTAALLVRGAALASVAADTHAFDPGLRYGEDVDLVWRLHDAGWRIRYEPSVQVPHDGPRTWPGLLSRRFRYGTAAAPLARRHAGKLAPLVVQPWPAVCVAALLARRPGIATAAATASWLSLRSTLWRAGLPGRGATTATLTAVRQTWLGAGRYATQFAAPALLAALAGPGGSAPVQRAGRRAAVASLLLGPAVETWRTARTGQRASGLDPARFILGHIADDIAYGAGVWAGCARERTLEPLTPVIAWRPLRAAGLVRAPRQGRGHEGTAPDGQ